MIVANGTTVISAFKDKTPGKLGLKAIETPDDSTIMFHLKNRRLTEQKAESAAWERRLFDRLTDFLDGFKEVRLNSARSAELFEDAADVSRVAANIKIRTQAETFKMIVNSQISMYVLLGAVVFVAPTLSDSLGGASISNAVIVYRKREKSAFRFSRNAPRPSRASSLLTNADKPSPAIFA